MAFLLELFRRKKTDPKLELLVKRSRVEGCVLGTIQYITKSKLPMKETEPFFIGYDRIDEHWNAIHSIPLPRIDLIEHKQMVDKQYIRHIKAYIHHLQQLRIKTGSALQKFSVTSQEMTTNQLIQILRNNRKDKIAASYLLPNGEPHMSPVQLDWRGRIIDPSVPKLNDQYATVDKKVNFVNDKHIVYVFHKK
jgi:hypothetical protein